MNNTYDDIKEYLKGKRTISVANICTIFEKDSKTIYPIIEQLEVDKVVRTVNSSCTTNCSSCSSSCGSGDKPQITTIRDETIVVSLHI